MTRLHANDIRAKADADLNHAILREKSLHGT
jgi:hypothetical protein